MNLKKIQNITTDIQSLQSGKFEMINGWGIIGFRSVMKSAVNDSVVRVMGDHCDAVESHVFLRKLNDAIQPVLAEEIARLKCELRELMKEEQCQN
jgi:hypothetical protein